MGTLFGLFGDVGDFFRSLRRALQLGKRTVDAACDDVEARLELPAPKVEPVAVPQLPMHDDPADPDAKVPATRRLPLPSRNGHSPTVARKVKK
jgi:hypothetical protein